MGGLTRKGNLRRYQPSESRGVNMTKDPRVDKRNEGRR